MRTSGVLLEPLLEAGLGAVGLGGVEGADAAGVGEPEQAVEDAALAQAPVPMLEHRDLDAGLAQLPLGERPASWRRRPAPPAPEAAPRAEAVASAPAWRNVRRSVRFVSSWAIALDSSMDRTFDTSLRSLTTRILARPDRFRTVNRRGKQARTGNPAGRELRQTTDNPSMNGPPRDRNPSIRRIRPAGPRASNTIVHAKLHRWNGFAIFRRPRGRRRFAASYSSIRINP